MCRARTVRQDWDGYMYVHIAPHHSHSHWDQLLICRSTPLRRVRDTRCDIRHWVKEFVVCVCLVLVWGLMCCLLLQEGRVILERALITESDGFDDGQWNTLYHNIIIIEHWTIRFKLHQLFHIDLRVIIPWNTQNKQWKFHICLCHTTQQYSICSHSDLIAEEQSNVMG